MPALPLELKDSFGQWKDKINDMVTLINASENQINNLNTKTPFSVTASSALNVTILGGRVRDNSVVETIADSVIAVNANNTNIIAIYKKSPAVASLMVYNLADLPEKFVIPLYSITTDLTDVVSVVDLRTAYITSAGSAGSDNSAVMQFDRLISENVTIAPERNGLSVAPVVAPGVTVNVSPGSVWVVL